MSRLLLKVLRAAGMAAVAGASISACSSMRPAPPPPPVSAAGTPCQDVNFPIYFAKGSDELTDPARQAIAAGQSQARGCTIREVDVFGLADMDGPADRNLALSHRRATVVAQALAAAGLPRPLFDVQGLGESGARTAKGAPALLQRKAVVVIRVSPAA